jgi:hypothetical protein
MKRRLNHVIGIETQDGDDGEHEPVRHADLLFAVGEASLGGGQAFGSHHAHEKAPGRMSRGRKREY